MGTETFLSERPFTEEQPINKSGAPKRAVDLPLLVVVIALVVFGLIMMFSCSQRPGLGDVMKQRRRHNQIPVYGHPFFEVVCDRQGHTHHLSGMGNDVWQHAVSCHEFIAFLTRWNSICRRHRNVCHIYQISG